MSDWRAPLERQLENASDRAAAAEEDAASQGLTGDVHGGAGPAASPPAAQPYPQLRRRYNTGPKGVLADYAEWQEQQRKKQLEAEHNHIAEAVHTVPHGGADPALQQWRLARMQELQVAAQRSSFGVVHNLAAHTYTDSIDCVDALVPVVVHLYENSHDGCVRVNRYFTQLALEYTNTKFSRIVATEAQADFDHYALPAVLLYRGGELVKGLLRLQDILGESFEYEDLRDLLERNGCFDYLGAEEQAARVANAETFEAQRQQDHIVRLRAQQMADLDQMLASDSEDDMDF